MSSISPVSAQISSATAMSMGQVGGASACSAAMGLDATAAPNGAFTLQQSLLMQGVQGKSDIDTLATLALALLLSKNNDSQNGNNDDPWKALMAMAMFSGMAQSASSSISMTHNTSIVTQAYAVDGAAAGAAINAQG